MAQALPHLIGFVVPAIVVASASAGGWWTFTPLAFLYVILPLVDGAAGRNEYNPAESEAAALDANRWFHAITWLWVPIHLALLAWAFSALVVGGLSPLERVGLTISVGLTAGAIGITFAHELVHRPGALERGLGEILLASVSYTHFAIEHVHGHHRHVATWRDPATSRHGESFYAFFPRSVFGGLRSAFRLEGQRLGRRGRSPWHISNRFWRYGATQAVLYGTAAWLGGVVGILFIAGQAYVAMSMLEVINYVEHYGLVRREISPGHFERVMPWHSWNSSHRVSNWMLINLARHSDHHCVASKRYQVLHHLDSAPQLPAGYGTMFLVALVPPLWFRIMDPRVDAWRARHGSSTITAT